MWAGSLLTRVRLYCGCDVQSVIAPLGLDPMAVTFPFLPQCPEIDAADNLVCIYTVIGQVPLTGLK